MSAENLDNPVYYEQLDELEYEFEQVELEIRKSCAIDSHQPRASQRQ
jgi:hypothetical protein